MFWVILLFVIVLSWFNVAFLCSENWIFGISLLSGLFLLLLKCFLLRFWVLVELHHILLVSPNQKVKWRKQNCFYSLVVLNSGMPAGENLFHLIRLFRKQSKISVANFIPRIFLLVPIYSNPYNNTTSKFIKLSFLVIWIFILNYFKNIILLIILNLYIYLNIIMFICCNFAFSIIYLFWNI